MASAPPTDYKAVSRYSNASAWLASADGIDPSADLNFATSNYWLGQPKRSLPEWLSASGAVLNRVSTAYAMNALGILAPVAPDTVHQPFDPVISAFRGIKVERQSANLIVNSSLIAANGNNNATAAVSPVQGPDKAYSLTRATSTAANGYVQTQNYTLPGDGSTFCCSAIVPKTGASNLMQLYAVFVGGSAKTSYITVDQSTGIISTQSADAVGVVDMGSFWLIWFSQGINTNTVAQVRIYPCTTAAGTVDIGFVQLEAAFYPTSRIVTIGIGGLRRERDAFTVPGAAVFGAGTGTLTVTARPPGGATTRVIAQVDDGTEANRVTIQRDAAGTISVVWVSSGTVLATMALGAHTALTDTTVSIGWDAVAGTMRAIRDGATLTKLAGTPPAVTTLRLGANSVGASLDGTISRLTTWSDLRTEPFYEACVGSIDPVGDSMAAGAGTDNPPADTWPQTLETALQRPVVTSSHGYAGQTSSTVLANYLADGTRRSWTKILFIGHNSPNAAQTLADVKSILALSTNNPAKNRFLVLSTLQNGGNAVGGAAYQAVLDTRTALKAAFPANYVDVFSPIQAAATSSAQDQSDVANGYTPTSLRTSPNTGTVDPIHLNATGQTIIKAAVQAALLARGW